jgi:hypothetical protein
MPELGSESAKNARAIMATKAPPPLFEVVFEGAGIYPEKIPLGTLARALQAVQRLAAGKEVSDEEGPEHDQEEESIRLSEIRRGSAVFRFVGPPSPVPVQRLRLVGEVLDTPDHIGHFDYILNPIELLSGTARNLGCSIVVREPGKEGRVLARIEPGSYQRISEALFIEGETSITGEVKRVGGVTEIRCALRVPFQQRLLFCKVGGADVARGLGDCLYKRVVVQGRGCWIKGTWRIVSFTITGVQELHPGPLKDALRALREAGGKAWDEVDDPEAFLEEVTGK